MERREVGTGRDLGAINGLPNKSINRASWILRVRCIEAQQAAVVEFAEAEGFEPVQTFLDVILPEGRSGGDVAFNNQRPPLERAIEFEACSNNERSIQGIQRTNGTGAPVDEWIRDALVASAGPAFSRSNRLAITP